MKLSIPVALFRAAKKILEMLKKLIFFSGIKLLSGNRTNAKLTFKEEEFFNQGIP